MPLSAAGPGSQPATKPTQPAPAKTSKSLAPAAAAGYGHHLLQPGACQPLHVLQECVGRRWLSAACMLSVRSCGAAIMHSHTTMTCIW